MVCLKLMENPNCDTTLGRIAINNAKGVVTVFTT